MKYKKRMIDNLLTDSLDAFGAVLIEGPKWCGKTTTANQFAKSKIWLEDPDNREKYEATAQSTPSMLLKGDKPRLIDEWQDIPVLWDAVRTSVDRSDDVGLYILTGSAVVDKSKIKHSGTGRIDKLKMYPMSLYESGESNGKISIQELFNNSNIDIDGISSDCTVPELVFATCRGGWPGTFKARADNVTFSSAGNGPATGSITFTYKPTGYTRTVNFNVGFKSVSFFKKSYGESHYKTVSSGGSVTLSKSEQTYWYVYLNASTSYQKNVRGGLPKSISSGDSKLMTCDSNQSLYVDQYGRLSISTITIGTYTLKAAKDKTCTVTLNITN